MRERERECEVTRVNELTLEDIYRGASGCTVYVVGDCLVNKNASYTTSTITPGSLKWHSHDMDLQVIVVGVVGPLRNVASTGAQ